MSNRTSDRGPIRRVFSINIGTILFGAVFLYIIVSMVLYLTANHVESYQVTAGPLAKNQYYTGLALRSERVISADTSGYITYYAREGSRVKRYGAVYGVGAEKSTESVGTLDEETAARINSDLRSFSLGFSPVDFHETYTLKYQLESDILGGSDIALYSNSIDSSGSMTIGEQTIATAPSPGIVSYLIDGYENYSLDNLTARDLDKKAYTRTNLKTNGEVRAGENVYKLIESEKWSLIIPLTSRQVVQLSDRTSIRVRFMKDNVTQTADFQIMTGADDSYFGKLDFMGGLSRYIDNRFIDIELVTNQNTGLKIPVTSLVSKEFYVIPEDYITVGDDGGTAGFLKVTTDREGNETTTFVTTTLYELKDGRYYVDNTDFSGGDVIIKLGGSTDRYIVRATDSLEGVYNLNKGYAVFRKVSIIDKNEQYCIVERGTRFGISQFDYIVLDASTVKESQITVR